MTLDQLPPRYREQAMRKLGLIPDSPKTPEGMATRDGIPVHGQQKARHLPPTSRKIGGSHLLKPERNDGKETAARKPRQTLMPDNAPSIVRDVMASPHEVRIVLSVNPQEIPTAQQKGVFVGKDGRVHFFTKAKIAKAAKALVQAFTPHSVHSSSWGNVPIGVEINFFFPFPSGTPKRDVHRVAPHVNRPDVDNCCKLILDCLTDSGMWKDDSLICNFLATKRRTTQQPCIVVRIENLQPKFDRLFSETDTLESMPLFNQKDSTDANQATKDPTTHTTTTTTLPATTGDYPSTHSPSTLISPHNFTNPPPEPPETTSYPKTEGNP